MKNFWKKLIGLRSKINKYWEAVIFFALLMLFFNDYTVFDRLSYDRQISKLRSQIDKLKLAKAENQSKLDALQSGTEGLEKIAREQYLMTEQDEDLFIIVE